MPTKLSHQQSLVPDVAGDVATKSWVEGLSGVSQGDYIFVSNSVQQTDPVGPDLTVAFDTVQSQRGALSNSGGVISGLKAGRTYLIIGNPRVTYTSAWDAFFYIWDLTADVAITGWRDLSSTWSTTPHESSPAAFPIVFTPDVDSLIELRLNNLTTNADIRTGSTLQVIEIGATVVNGISGLEYVDTIDVTVATNEVAFGAGGDGVLQRALDGDVDEEYFCSYYMPGDHAGSTMHWVVRPNGATTSQQSAADYSGATSGKITTSTFMLGDQFVARDVRGTFTLFAKTGRARYFVSDNVVTAPGGGAGEMHQSRNAGTWDEQVTNITSLVFAHTDGAGDYILPGAQFILWRRRPEVVRADNAAIYERNVEATVAQGTNGAVTYTGGRANFGGSAVGIGIELVDDTVVSGSIDAVLKIDGVAVLTATLDSVNTSFGRAAVATGIHAILAGNTVEIDVSTTSLVTTGVGTPAVVVNATLTNNAFILEALPTVGPDYLAGRLGSTQGSNLNVGNWVEWDQFSARGGITFSAGVGQQLGLITLPPFKTYEIYCALQGLINEGTGIWQWVDNNGGAAIVDDTGTNAPAIFLTDNHGTDNTEMTGCVMLFTPTVETTIRMQVASDTNIVSLSSHCNFLIKELR